MGLNRDRRGAVCAAGRMLLVLILIVAGAEAWGSPEILIASGEWPPYQSEQLPDYGLASKIVTEAFALQGISVRYTFIPWRRAVREAREGRIDGMMVWADDPDEHADFLFSNPIFDSKATVYFRRGEERDWREVADLAPLAIGAVRGYDYCPDFIKAEHDQVIRVDRAASEDLALSMLAANRVDAVIADQRVASYFLSSMPESSKIVTNQKALCTNPLGIVLSRKATNSGDLMDRFNTGLAELRRSGRLGKLLEL